MPEQKKRTEAGNSPDEDFQEEEILPGQKKITAVKDAKKSAESKKKPPP